MNWSTRLFFALVLSLVFSEFASAQVTAEWTSGTLNAEYCGARFCGSTSSRGLHVTSGSGYIDIVGTLNSGLSTAIGTRTRTTRMWVEEGIDYEVSLSVERGNEFITSASMNSTCYQVTFSSSGVLNPIAQNVGSFSTLANPLIFSCLAVVRIPEQEVDEFQLNASDGTFADHVRVTWNEIEGANTYRIFRCTDEDVNSCGTLIGLTSSNGFDDTEGDVETHYWYRVKSCTPGGCSGFSESDEGHRVIGDDHGDSCAEATPVDANSTTPSEFETFGDLDYFQIVLATAGSLTVKSLGDADTHGTLFDSDCNELARNYRDGENVNFRIQQELAAGTYYVDVNNFYTHYKGPYEFVSSFGDPSALPGPAGVSATDGAFTDRVRVTWGSVGAATHYEVYRCTNNMESSCGSPLGSPGGTSFDHMGGMAESTYWYRVKACSAVSCSPFSAADSGYVGAPVSIEDCDEAYVQLDNESLVINVAPTGLDDTVNIQCALDSAANTGVPTVRLGAGTYYISKLKVENFKGTFEGKTKTATILDVIDESIECEAMNDAGLGSSAIKFVKGEPRIRFMTIGADMPCSDNLPLDTIVHFTGGSALSPDCDNDVIFGVVDRLIIDGTTNDNGHTVGVEVAPEGKWLGGCKDTLLGTFKLNRSTITNTFYGLVTAMKAGAQVDVNFNEFRANQRAVNLFDTNQNTTITTNKFFGENTADYSYYGVIVSTFSDDPPPKSRMVVHNNEFNIASSPSDYRSYAVSVRFNLAGASEVIPDVSSVVTSNKFNLSGTTTYGLYFLDTSNTHVASNWFNGSGGRAILVAGDTPVSGWTISANMGLATFTSDFVEDVRLYSNTSNCIVGPGQGATIRDDGTDNTILPQ